MSHLLWKCFWDNDVDKFRHLLTSAVSNTHTSTKSPALSGNEGFVAGSPGAYGTPPRISQRSRKTSGQTPGFTRTRDNNFGKAEVNSRDHAGLTLLLRAASSTVAHAREFVAVLLDHPAIDIYVQDPESGWNSLHRALYMGNVSIARMLLEKERADLVNHGHGAASKVGLLIKTKDHGGFSPFDVYNSTIGSRSLRQGLGKNLRAASSQDSESDEELDATELVWDTPYRQARADELFVFGSNRNLSLGVGDEDDRQFPERVQLQRPDHLIRTLYQTYLKNQGLDDSSFFTDLAEIPALVKSSPIVIEDVVLSKVHSAIITADPLSNLYLCGVGRGGRLGLGDENTQFRFVPVQGPLANKKVHSVALGQNHTLAVAGDGELWTWGLNTDSQLGYILPAPARAAEEPKSLLPRQVFGAMKKEAVLGVAASTIHSVAHTGASLFCWGRNVGQLGLMDADSRSLDVQQTPRKVAASLLSASIEMVSAMDKATSCLLANRSIWVFTNYGYNLIKFPSTDVFADLNLTYSFSTRHDPAQKHVKQIASGGDTIAAVSMRGDLFTMKLSSNVDETQIAGSTTNPSKIKSAVTTPQCIWNSRKDGVVSVDVGENGSVIICTESGAVWNRIKRNTRKGVAMPSISDSRPKDFKFQRIPYATNCVGARSSTHGAFAVLRDDSKVMKKDIYVEKQTLWKNFAPLLCLNKFESSSIATEADYNDKSLWEDFTFLRQMHGTATLRILLSPNIEDDLARWLQGYQPESDNFDMVIRTTLAPNILVPVHGWVLGGRSATIREHLARLRHDEGVIESDTMNLEKVNGKAMLSLHEVDVYTMLNIVVFAYADAVVPVWRNARADSVSGLRVRQVRAEVMKLAAKLKMPNLEAAARLQTNVEPSLDRDMRLAMKEDSFFEDADVILRLSGGEVVAHSKLLCQRCSFFEGLFYGRSQGHWLTGRRAKSTESKQIEVDLQHIDPRSFEYVMVFLYADVGQDMFNDVISDDLDGFSELVVDVMSIANELMLDRLSQICQATIGKFANIRNIASLLNEISPCSVTGFKDAGLEYICLQLEGLLENHLLDGLDDELLQALDAVARGNQLACMPVARSNHAETVLHNNYPHLAFDIAEERNRRVREMAFKQSLRDKERKPAVSQSTRYGSYEDSPAGSLTQPRSHQRSKATLTESPVPVLHPKASSGDMMFEMEDDNSDLGKRSQKSPNLLSSAVTTPYDLGNMPQLPRSWRESSHEDVRGPNLSSSLAGTPLSVQTQTQDNLESASRTATSFRQDASPWAATAVVGQKLNLRNIMSETSSVSSLTEKLASGAGKQNTQARTQPKVSQKERKRQIQVQLDAQVAAQNDKANHIPWEEAPPGGREAPWKVVTPKAAFSLKDAMRSEEAMPKAAGPPNLKPLVASEANSSTSSPRRTASPDTRFPGQARSKSSPVVLGASASKADGKKPLIPHSKSYIQPAPKASATLGFSMSDIIGQQQREQEMVREAVAKRSLQEIQEEQAFQEWWDQESRRTQEEEARRSSRGKKIDTGNNASKTKKGRRGRGDGGGGGTSRVGDAASASSGPNSQHPGKAKRAGRGRGAESNASTVAS